VARRPGLDREAVVEAAAQLVDEAGATELSLTALAKRLGVKPPSLYNHVAGLEGLRRELRLRGLRELAAELQRAALGRAGSDAMRALAHAYRAYAAARPGLYALTQRSAGPMDEELATASEAVVGVVRATLRGFGHEGEAALHATRCLRSALHGFVGLEAEGGFGLDLPVDESFERLLTLLDTGLAA
jgi:AcrR family transcriptional regulator